MCIVKFDIKFVVLIKLSGIIFYSLIMHVYVQIKLFNIVILLKKIKIITYFNVEKIMKIF